MIEARNERRSPVTAGRAARGSRYERPPRPLALVALLLAASGLSSAIDWDSEIVASPDELATAKKDALSIYYKEKIDDPQLFRSYETMKELVGDFVDVPKKL